MASIAALLHLKKFRHFFDWAQYIVKRLHISDDIAPLVIMGFARGCGELGQQAGIKIEKLFSYYDAMAGDVLRKKITPTNRIIDYHAAVTLMKEKYPIMGIVIEQFRIASRTPSESTLSTFHDSGLDLFYGTTEKNPAKMYAEKVIAEHYHTDGNWLERMIRDVRNTFHRE